MEYLLHASGRAVLDFVKFADASVESGKLSKTRLLVPGAKRMKKWLLSVWSSNDGSQEDGHGLGDINETPSVFMGESYKVRKDPEHLPPVNAFERVGDAIRVIPGFLRSAESAFGFRVVSRPSHIALTCLITWFHYIGCCHYEYSDNWIPPPNPTLLCRESNPLGYDYGVGILCLNFIVRC
jgi:hypothetical protein